MTERRHRRSGAPNRNAATCLALTGLMACALGFVAFTAVVLPQIRGVILVIGGLSVFFLLHYLTWGRWMSHMREQEDDQAPPVSDERFP
jgi:hypothetical protein